MDFGILKIICGALTNPLLLQWPETESNCRHDQEAASLRWENVDMDAKTFTLHDTKNRNSHTLPMSDFLLEIFKRRQEAKMNEYVFSANSDTGHLIEPRKAMLKVAELSGVSFTVHDLRRTFVTMAESLEIPAYVLKRLLNHNMNHDVTADYIIMDIERLRKPVQKISDYFRIIC